MIKLIYRVKIKNQEFELSQKELEELKTDIENIFKTVASKKEDSYSSLSPSSPQRSITGLL